MNFSCRNHTNTGILVFQLNFHVNHVKQYCTYWLLQKPLKLFIPWSTVKKNPKKLKTASFFKYFVVTFQSAMSSWLSANGGGRNHFIPSGKPRSHARIQKISRGGGVRRINFVLFSVGGGEVTLLYVNLRGGAPRLPRAQDPRKVSSQWSTSLCSLTFFL